MEPGSRGVTGVQSDCLLRRPDHSWHACNRVSTTPTRTPSHRLQQMEAAASWGSSIWRSHSPTATPWGQEEHWIMGHSEEDCGSALPRRTGPANASTTLDDALHAPDGTCPTTMPSRSGHALPTSGATAKKSTGRESLLTPPQVKLPLWVAQHRTVEGLQQEGGDMAAAPLVTQAVYQGWWVCSHSIRRVVCPPG